MGATRHKPVSDNRVTEAAAEAVGTDVAKGLRGALALRRLAEELETMQVIRARRAGWSWQDIAEALAVSKQAVHKKYAELVDDRRR